MLSRCGCWWAWWKRRDRAAEFSPTHRTEGSRRREQVQTPSGFPSRACGLLASQEALLNYCAGAVVRKTL
jgi:hypothetical protein